MGIDFSVAGSRFVKWEEWENEVETDYGFCFDKGRWRKPFLQTCHVFLLTSTYHSHT